MKTLLMLLVLGVGTAHADLNTVYFDSGKATLRKDAKVLLAQNVLELKKSDRLVLIEGRCDYREDTVYNLSLGQQRATSIRKFYMENGISGDRLVTVSFGKENHVVNCEAVNRSGLTRFK